MSEIGQVRDCVEKSIDSTSFHAFMRQSLFSIVVLFYLWHSKHRMCAAKTTHTHRSPLLRLCDSHDDDDGK